MLKFCVFVFTLLIANASFAQSDMQLRFDSPAKQFTESVPLGNGTLGAMVFGGTNVERIVLNEKSMWSGGVQDPNRHDAHKYLPEIQKLLQEEKNKEAVIYLTTFSKLIRNQLNNAEREVSLHDELETCKLYVQLEALRFGGKIVTEFKVDEHLDIYSLKVPPLLLQPFIENAIWHGILPKQNGKVTVSVIGKNGSIHCLIDDNGIGREMAMQNKLKASSTYESKGMGLVKTRLTMYNNISANKASIEVIDKKENDKPAGTLVIIKFKSEV